MKYVKYLALLSTLTILLPIWALARDNNQHSVDIVDPVQVDGSQLKPGTYKVEWQEAGPMVHVKFLQSGKTVLTVPATLKANSQITQDDIVIGTTGANQKVLDEIDFNRQKESLLFGRHQGGM
jgi:hypothetical protein